MPSVPEASGKRNWGLSYLYIYIYTGIEFLCCLDVVCCCFQKHFLVCFNQRPKGNFILICVCGGGHAHVLICVLIQSLFYVSSPTQRPSEGPYIGRATCHVFRAGVRQGRRPLKSKHRGTRRKGHIRKLGRCMQRGIIGEM